MTAPTANPMPNSSFMLRLHVGAVGTLENVHCSGARRGRSREGFIAVPHFVLPHAGNYIWHTSDRDVFADANVLLFFRGGETYSTSHPLGGDDAMVITPRASALAELTHGGARRIDDHAAFASRSRLATCELQMASRMLRAAAESGRESLEIDELMVDLIARMLEDSTVPSRPASGAARQTLDRAKAYLHAYALERLCLDQVAAAAGVTPVYLTQLFKRVEGIPLYQYALKLRLATALDRLRDCHDITGLALDLGFSSHSHFTAVFSSRFGVPPSRLRAEMRGRGGGREALGGQVAGAVFAHPWVLLPLCEARGGEESP